MPLKAANDDPEKARRFRDAALPHLDAAYTLARYLLRDATDAEDAVQECYLRAFKHFDSYRGPAMKPWLFAILRNVCRTEYARRASAPTMAVEDVAESAEQTPLWHEAQETPEAQMLRRWDADTIRRLVTALAEPFRETFVLREINNLSYREIADAASGRRIKRDGVHWFRLFSSPIMLARAIDRGPTLARQLLQLGKRRVDRPGA